MLRLTFRTIAALALAGFAAAARCPAVSGDRVGRPPVISLDTAGGDTWRFQKTITGRMIPGACNTIVVRSPQGDTRALLLDRGRFVAAVHLHSGANQVRAACRRAGTATVTSAAQHWTVRIDDRPRAWIRTRVESGSVRMDAGATEIAAGIPAPLVSYDWRSDARNPAPLHLAVDNRAMAERVEFNAPVVDGDYRVRLRVSDSLGRSDESTTLFRVANGRATQIDIQSARPEWLEGATIYGAAPASFTPIGFEGVKSRLDAIAALGASIVWLTPVSAAPAGDFGYAVTNHFQVRIAFGSEAQLHALIDAAHARGLKVLLDFVSNHLSDAHPYYVDAERRGTASPYYDWFERDTAGKAVHYFDWRNLENLDYDNPEVRAYIIAACDYWVRTYHIDGFRMDAAWAVRERAPEFWPLLRRELRRIDPQIVLLAEASARDPYYRTHGFDAAYDWTSKLGEWAWQRAYAGGAASPNLQELRAALTEGADGTVMHFLDNNDTGARFISRHGIDQTRTAAALLFTVPGLPLVYEGDEVGAAFEPYGAGPPIVWRDAYGLERLYTQLAHLRRENTVLRSGELQLLSSDHDDTLLAYARRIGGRADVAIVAINFGATPITTHLEPIRSGALCADSVLAGQCLTNLLDTTSWLAEDLVTGTEFELDAGASTLHLAAHDALLLRPLQHRTGSVP